MNRSLFFISALALCACPSQTPPAPGPEVVVTPSGPALPVDHPKVDVVTSREANRVSVAQLRGMLPVVFGNDVNGQPITWRVTGQNGLDLFALTLGEPDYIAVTDENLEPSPLYLKFMDDLARDVCDRALTADAAKADASQRVLMRYADADANLKYLKLRFHGVHDPDAASISALRGLFDKVSGNGTNPKEGWRAVCVALTTAPEFHLY